jgi:hypothetical protein
MCCMCGCDPGLSHCEILGCHGGENEDRGLLRSDTK